MKHIQKTFKKVIFPKMRVKANNIKIYIKEIDFDDKLSPQINFDINETHRSSVTISASAS
jgi:hypothetical protein